MRVQFFVLAAFFNLLQLQINAQEYLWAKNIVGHHNTCHDVSIDPGGNLFLTGYIQDTADFDADTGSYVLNGDFDAYLARYRSDGTLLWAVNFGGHGEASGWRCESDGQGNVVVFGKFTDTVDFDPGPGTHYLSTLQAAWFFAKYDSVGALSFAGIIEPNSPINNFTYYNINDPIRLNQKGDMIMVGYFMDSVDFDQFSGKYILVDTTFGLSGFVVKYDEAMNLLWARQLHDSVGYGACFPEAVSMSELGSVYVSGYFGGQIDFDPSPITQFVLNGGNGAAFLAKYDSSGNFIWARSFASSNSEIHCNSLADDGSQKIYATGTYQGQVDFDPGPGTYFMDAGINSAIFLSCFEKNGDFKWAKTLAGNSWSYPSKISLDGSGNIYIAGSLNGSADFDPGPDTAKLNSNGPEDLFFVKYDTAGNYLWARHFGAGDADRGYGLEIDASDNLYVTGEIAGNDVDCNPGWGIDYLHQYLSHSSVFAKFSPCSPPHSTILNDTICQGEIYTFLSGRSSGVSVFDTSLILTEYGCDSNVITNLFVRDFSDSVTLNGNVITAQFQGGAYQWLKCDGTGYTVITGETSQSYSPSSNGSYAVAVSGNSCSDTSDCIEITALEVMNVSDMGKVVVFPNPSKGPVTIDLAGLKDVRISIHDAKGNLLHSDEGINAPLYKFNLERNPGLYILEVRSDIGIIHFKLVRQ